jgi:hypothetical protein
MTITISQFELLRTRFPTWPELKNHFESEDGVGLRVVEQGEFAVIRYEKGASTDGIYRSVVWDKATNMPLCVAPFRAKEGVPVQIDVTVEDFVDGVMMNAWVSNGVLQIATRTRIGGDNTFYSQKTFRKLFEECLATTSLKTMDGLRDSLEGLRTDVNGTSAFASFVIQHPEHRVVAKVPSPNLYVVHTGYVSSAGVVQISERKIHWPQDLARLSVYGYMGRRFTNAAEVDDLLLCTAAQHGWRWQGLVFKDGTGARWRIRTPTYSVLRELRGPESTSLERFFRLRAGRQVSEYLKHYGEERQLFWKYEHALRSSTEDVLKAYTDVHKSHARAFKDLPEAIRPAVFLLHAKWREELRPKGFSVRLQNAIEIVNGLRPFEKKRLLEAAKYEAAPSQLPGISEDVTEESTSA